MGMKTPMICEIAPDTYAINEFGLAAMYLLAGKDRALLIDTACGYCNLPEIVAGLTDKPLMVALTHGHFDHTGGAGWFDEIYMNEKDFGMLRDIDWKGIKEYADMFGKAGSYETYDFSLEDIHIWEKTPQLISIGDGDSFELGDRLVTVHEIPGHTPGGLCFLDEKNRIMFSGDCCNTNLLAPNCSVEETQEAIEKFLSLSGRFDQNFNGHAGYMGRPDCLSQPGSVPQDLLTICRLIRSGQGTAEPFDFLGNKFTKMSYGNARLSYDPARLNRADEK